jgi:hypothetical protein
MYHVGMSIQTAHYFVFILAVLCAIKRQVKTMWLGN